MRGGAIRRGLATMGAVLVSAVMLGADTLHFRDGRQAEGRLVGIQNGTVEFRQGNGWSARTLRVDIRDVRRIDFDDYGSGNDDRYGGGNDDRRGPGGGRGRPSGLREREVVVTASEAWNDTGLDVRGDALVYFEARGQVTWGRGRRDGPEGEKNSPRNPGRPIPNRPGAGLIGKIGANSQDYFFIGGERGPFTLRGTGRLFLGINDDFLLDNTGNFRVSIYY